MDYPGRFSELNYGSLAGDKIQRDYPGIFGKLQLETGNLFSFDVRAVSPPDFGAEPGFHTDNHTTLDARELLDCLPNQGLGEKIGSGLGFGVRTIH